MATITFDEAQRWYPGTDQPAVRGVELEIKDGEFMVFVGPSGRGKSTTLRLAGLEEVNDGGRMTPDVTLGIRPESWRTAAEDEPGLRVKVSVVEELGADAFVYGATKIDGVRHDLIVRIPGRVIPGRGEFIRVTTDPDQVHVFDTASGERLNP